MTNYNFHEFAGQILLTYAILWLLLHHMEVIFSNAKALLFTSIISGREFPHAKYMLVRTVSRTDRDGYGSEQHNTFS